MSQINAVNQIVGDLFNVLPDHPKGRIQPFDRNTEAPTLAPKWRFSHLVGRMTVWNMTTRGPRNIASRLFEQGDIRPAFCRTRRNCWTELNPKLERRGVGGFSLRDEAFPAPPTPEALNVAAVDDVQPAAGRDSAVLCAGLSACLSADCLNGRGFAAGESASPR